MNYRKFKFYIVVDSKDKPMTFFENQFCYNDTEDNSRPFAIQLYTRREAMRLINKSIEFRKSLNFNIGEYVLMPIQNQ